MQNMIREKSDFKPLYIVVTAFLINHPHNEHTGNGNLHPM